MFILLLKNAHKLLQYYMHALHSRSVLYTGEAFTLKEGKRNAPLREKPSIPPLFAQSTRDVRGSRGRLTFSSFFSSSRKAETPLTIVWNGWRKQKRIYFWKHVTSPLQFQTNPVGAVRLEKTFKSFYSSSDRKRFFTGGCYSHVLFFLRATKHKKLDIYYGNIMETHIACMYFRCIQG